MNRREKRLASKDNMGSEQRILIEAVEFIIYYKN